MAPPAGLTRKPRLLIPLSYRALASRVARSVLPVAVVVYVADRPDWILSKSRVLEKAHLSSQCAAVSRRMI
jgi:hypothetical protein